VANRDVGQLKQDLVQAVSDKPFKTTFKVVMAYHLANTVSALVGLSIFGTILGLVYLVLRSLS
jgi:hypothetical protein